MKFIPDEFEMFAKNERQAYATLGAVNRTETETMGIPTLYHYGKWKNYSMIGITLLDSEFQKRKKNNQLTTVDKLIVFQEVVSSFWLLLLLLSIKNQNWEYFFMNAIKGENIRIYS